MKSSQYDLDSLLKKAKHTHSSNTVFLKKLKDVKPKDLDKTVKHFHSKVFETIDCLQCAGCCRTISPIILNEDIDRIAKYVDLPTRSFIETYLYKDQENDFVFKQTPCPFLSEDNTCKIYEKRPKACYTYPHTDRNRFHQLLNLTLKNSLVCPAVFLIIENLKKHYSSLL